MRSLEWILLVVSRKLINGHVYQRHWKRWPLGELEYFSLFLQLFFPDKQAVLGCFLWQTNDAIGLAFSCLLTLDVAWGLIRALHQKESFNDQQEEARYHVTPHSQGAYLTKTLANACLKTEAFRGNSLIVLRKKSVNDKKYPFLIKLCWKSHCCEIGAGTTRSLAKTYNKLNGKTDRNLLKVESCQSDSKQNKY